MTTAKSYFVPTLIILLAGLVVSFAALPLANTEWAEGFRTDVGEEQPAAQEGAGQAEAGEPQMGGVATAILPVVKVMLFMGVGVLLTMLGRGIVRLAGRFRRRDQRGAAAGG
ncbi:MAG: hypothetical protein KDD78_17585 [Caldilineaceae bacterium]|nr:hypothetical protein [Caldilineaceae bacterium]